MTKISAPTKFSALDRLSQFADGLQDDDRIRASGSSRRAVLYRRAGPSRGNLLERAYNTLHGRAEVRKMIEAALAEVERGVAGNAKVTKAIDDLRNALPQRGDLRAGAIKTHLQTIRDELVRKPSAHESHLALISAERTDPEWAEIATQLRGGDLKAAERYLTEKLIKHISVVSNSETQRKLLESRVLEEEILACIQREGHVHAKSGDPLKWMIKRAVNTAVRGIAGLPVAHGTLALSPNRMPERITIAGIDYICPPRVKLSINRTDDPGLLGAGMVKSEVRVYTAADGRKVVLKVAAGDENTPEGMARQFDETAHEIAMNRRASAGNPDHAVKVLGGVRLLNGNLGVLTEWMPHGDLNGVVENNLLGPVQPLPQADPVRTMLAKRSLELLVGLLKSKTAHMDGKAANLMIAADGSPRLADLGEARPGEPVTICIADFTAQNPLWTDPLIFEALKAASDAWKKELDALDQDVNNGKVALKDKKQHQQEIKSRHASEPVAISGAGADAWGWGIMLYELYSGGRNPFDGGGNEEIKKRTSEFILKSDDERKAALFPRPTRVPEDMQQIILGLLQAEPAKRIEAAKAAAGKDMFVNFSQAEQAIAQKQLLAQIQKHRAAQKPQAAF